LGNYSLITARQAVRECKSSATRNGVWFIE